MQPVNLTLNSIHRRFSEENDALSMVRKLLPTTTLAELICAYV